MNIIVYCCLKVFAVLMHDPHCLYYFVGLVPGARTIAASAAKVKALGQE